MVFEYMCSAVVSGGCDVICRYFIMIVIVNSVSSLLISFLSYILNLPLICDLPYTWYIGKHNMTDDNGVER